MPGGRVRLAGLAAFKELVMGRSALVRRVCVMSAVCLAGLGLGVPASLAQPAGVSAAKPHSVSLKTYKVPGMRAQKKSPERFSAPGGLAQAPGMSVLQRAAAGSALARAVASGRPVGVGALTTATSTVTALPDGRLSLTESVLPERVRRGSGWVAVNTSLRLADGRWAARAVPVALSLSAGGRGALAVLGTGGRAVAVRWPGVLPRPVVSGAVARYRGVLPGVDLVVTASVTGFSEVLVVKDAAAARDRGLRLLRLAVAGARVFGEADGSVAAVRGGRVAFTAERPLMWDSSVTARPATAGATGRAGGVRGAAVVALRSSVAGPGSAAHLASGRLAVGRAGAVTMSADEAVLASRQTVFPAYIGATMIAQASGWTGQTYSPDNPAFDMVQQGSPCDAVSYYDNENPDDNTDSLGVGYFPSSWGSCSGTQNAYYEMPFSSVIDGSVIHLATVNAAEDYSSSCGTDHNVNLILTGTIGKTTDYAHQPSWRQSDLDVTQNGTGVPDTAGSDINCNVTTLGPSKYSEPYGFTVTSTIATAAKSPYWSSFTFVLTESSQDSSGDSLKRFTNNPSMTIQYAFLPNAPTKLDVGDNSTDLQSCPSSGTLPRLGASSGTGVELQADFSQKNSDSLTGYFDYWDVTKNQTSATNKALTVTPADSSTGAAAHVTIAQSTINGYSDGDTIDVKVYAVDAVLSSDDGPSSTCSFQVWPTDPGGTTVTMTSPANPPMGSTATFTLAAATPSACTAASFEWELDEPPVAGAENTVTATSGTATISVIVPSPGNHQLEAFANCSNNPNPTTDTGSAPFTVGGDPALNCGSWAKALANQCTNSAGTLVTNEPFDNTMLSGDSGSCGTTVGDGAGDEFDYAQLKARGWVPGGSVTVDGAGFTLPSFGNCAADNVLAADQTIAMGGQGSALVLLATSSNAEVPLTAGTGTTGSLWGSDATAPPVASGTNVTGTGCAGLDAFSGSDTGCVPATGTITYTNGDTATYDLTVPDWIWGPSDIAAVGTADSDNSAGSSATSPHMYAFSVPLNPSLTVASVTLPDVDDAVYVPGLSYNLPALHVFGMSVRNTATATPAVSGTSTAVPTSCGCGWTGAFESPIEAGFGPSWPSPSSVANQTYRMAVSMNVSAPAGSLLRIRLSNPGFLGQDTDGAITIGDATVAQQYLQAIPDTTPTQLTFSGQKSATLCAGCDLYSDPLTLPFAVTAGQNLLISIYVANGSSASPYPAIAYVPGTMWPSGASAWVSSAAGDQTGDTAQTDFGNSQWQIQNYLLSGVDVTTPAETFTESGYGSGTVATPGEPTVVVAGNNLTDLLGSNYIATADIGPSSFRIAGQLATAIPAGQTTPTAQGGSGADYGVVDAGIESNQLLADSPLGGVGLLARFDRDVLAEPDVGTVVINEGLEDLLLEAAAGDANIAGNVETAIEQLQTILTGYGISIVVDTLPPCAGYLGTGSPADACPAGGTADSARQNGVDAWIAGETQAFPLLFGAPNLADTDCAVSTLGPGTGCNQSQSAEQTETLASGYGAGPPPGGDWVNLSETGYAQAATAITAGDLYPPLAPGT
jgi:hypothetical protein